MQKKFNRIAIIGRQRLENIQETLASLYHYLKAHGYHVFFELETGRQLSFIQPNECIPCEQLATACELLLVVGGDGSLLHAAHIAVDQSLPVLGINRGRLGFLTDIYPHEFSKIEQVLNGHYVEEKRFLLAADINQPGSAPIQALNEIVLSQGNSGHMLEFSISIDQQAVCEFRSDGLIISTPTGSTAYALSGGGPILHPTLNAMVLVPMFPHTLSNRPLVIDGGSQLTIHISASNKAAPYLTGDGQQPMNVPLPGEVLIKKKAKFLSLIHPLDYNYYQTLRSKLGWQLSVGLPKTT